MIVEKAKITEGLERESSLLSVNLSDNNGVSMYDRVFVFNDAILAGAVSEAVNILTREMATFVTGYTDYTDARARYVWDMTKEPHGIADDALNYIVCYTMHEWFVKSLNNSGQNDSFAGRAAASMQNILRKLYHKPSP